MSIRKIFIARKRLRSGWRILAFLAIAFPSLYYLTLLMWEEMLLRYFIIFWLLLAFSFLAAKFLDKRPPASIGFSFHSRFLIEYLQGVGIGIALVSLLFFLELSAGHLEVSFRHLSGALLKDILVIALLTTFFQSAFEELFFRGYLFQTLIEGTNAFFAVLILSVLFGIGHLVTPNSSWIVAVNLSVFGAMHAIAYLKTRSLFMASGLHFSWNFFMRNVYSLPVSGTETSRSFLDVRASGPQWVTGGDYGPEAGIPALLLMIICSIFIWYWPGIRKESGIRKFWEQYKARFSNDS